MNVKLCEEVEMWGWRGWGVAAPHLKRRRRTFFLTHRKKRNCVFFVNILAFLFLNLVGISKILFGMFSFHWLTKIKMAAILVAKMAVNMAAISTTIPSSFLTTWQIYLKCGLYVYHMTIQMHHSLIYKNSKWLPSWMSKCLPTWLLIQLQYHETFKQLDRFCYKLVGMSIIWSYICSICWVTKIQHGRYHGCQYGRHYNYKTP